MVISDQQTRTTNTNNRVLPGFLHKMVGLCFRKTETCQNGLQPVVQNSSLEQQMVLGLSMPWFCLPWCLLVLFYSHVKIVVWSLGFISQKWI